MTAMRRALLVLLAAATIANAADRLVSIDTRPGVRVGYWLMERPAATATVMLLPGGEGGIGYKGGMLTSRNFLVRSRDLFAAEGFNVAVVGKPTDHDDLDLVFRAGADHVEDLRVIAERLKTQLGKPVWLVGTSRGTVSAAAAAEMLDPATVAGIVLTSSVTYVRSAPAVPTMALQNIRVPVLVMHHKRDACKTCDPREAHLITERLTGAPVKKLLLVDGGEGAHGDPCEPMHYHGYIGMEKEAVAAIAAFIARPAP
jgi:pimeloyl-ACP methyl ester carboxylesterase